MPKPDLKAKVGAGCLLLALAVVAVVSLFSQSGDDSAPATKDAKAPWEPKPEMIVKLAKSEGHFACVTKDKYEEAIGHAVAHERTKFGAMFEALDCVELTPGEATYKILSVQPIDFVEFTATDSGQSDGMWTEATSFEPAK